MSDINKKLAERIVSLRKAAGMSQKSLSETIIPPMSQQLVSKYENGSIRWYADVLLRFAAAIGVTVREVFDVSESSDIGGKLSVDDIVLRIKIQRLSEDQKRMAFRFIDSILGEENGTH